MAAVKAAVCQPGRRTTVAWLRTDFSADARESESPEQNLRAKAAVPDVSSGIFSSHFQCCIAKEKRTIKNAISRPEERQLITKEFADTMAGKTPPPYLRVYSSRQLT